jgi:nucleoside-diphosphate-sugar epimerase
VSATVLVTGATGFLGGALAAHLLATRPDLRLILVARAAGAALATSRVQRSLSRHGDLPGAHFAGRIEIVTADLGEPGWLATVPFARVTHVVNLALDAGSSPRARAVNLDGPLALAREAQRGGRLQRFLHVGSAWSCGAGARGVVGEDDAPRGEPVSTSLVHKHAAERALEGLPGLPLVIARPSLVVGHSTRGCEPSASLFWVLRLLDALGRIPWEKRRHLDAVPVDWVAVALTELLFAPTLGHVRHHLSAGRSGSVTWGDIESAFAAVGRRPRWREEAPTSLDDWASSVAPAIPAGALAPCLRFLGGDAVFDDSRARTLGLPAAPRLTEYLAVCLRRARDRPIAEQALDDL